MTAALALCRSKSTSAYLGKPQPSRATVIEEQSRLLAQSLALLDSDEDEDVVAGALMTIKHNARTMSAIEGYGMPPLHCQSEQAVFLNDVLAMMHRETGLPFPCPAASCTSSEYYFTHLPTNAVHVPLSEAAFLLHMPDFYHELGHLLLDHSNYGEKSRIILDGVASATKAIDITTCKRHTGRSATQYTRQQRTARSG